MMKDNSESGWGSGAFSSRKEKYVAPSYNYMINKGYKVVNYHMEDDEFLSLEVTPTDILIHIKDKMFCKQLKISRKANQLLWLMTMTGNSREILYFQQNQLMRKIFFLQ